VVFAAAIVIVALSALAQLTLMPTYVRGAYLLRPTTIYSLQERQQADALFARYRREGKPEEPVVASTLLFRYAHDRNLFWLNRLHNQPAPLWVLGDTADPYLPLRISLDKTAGHSAIRIEEYTLLERNGRFVLMKKKE
jgi:hypothetical protein